MIHINQWAKTIQLHAGDLNSRLCWNRHDPDQCHIPLNLLPASSCQTPQKVLSVNCDRSELLCGARASSYNARQVVLMLLKLTFTTEIKHFCMFLCVFEDCHIYFSNEFKGEKTVYFHHCMIIFCCHCSSSHR